ncbi:MAG: valine--tRNA ligase [Deltaproteobacteria bacterium]|nr:MAG: valine--tRNA ligase [Deltaproteobacteria bacterium]
MKKHLLDKTYEPARVEGKWYQYWEKEGLFHADENSHREPFSIVIPPPNITGSLHMGHALNNTLQDILVRYKRMNGFTALWMPGTDHAGIATQNVLEKQLAKEGVNRQELGREKFIERVWKWREESGRTIVNQLKRLGSSCDWQRERFTMDESSSRAVREVFVSLYEQGLIYRDDYIINWCPRCLTALSDLEVEHEEYKGKLYYLAYPIIKKDKKTLPKGAKKWIMLATTRPETMLGDTAVAVHPEDRRYQYLIGGKVLLPIMEREIPVISDEYVDQGFGSGVVKITPAHDFNDFEIGLRHDLDLIKVIDEDGRMGKDAGIYQGLDRYDCREKLLQDLKKNKCLKKIEDYQHSIGYCYRCRTAVEPLVSKQWFLKIQPLAQPAIEAVKDGRTRIIPQTWEKSYFNWMNNIRDWCISRQIWWGHRIPAWHCQKCGQITVSREDPACCSSCQSPEIKQETDVLDTWFSSALWPFSTMKWPEKTKELKTFYPTSVLVTGFDILFFWVARMMMMGLKFMDDVPFRDVYIHALVRDIEGQKMSKSKGNIIDPLLVMDKFGTDALRFTLAAFAAQGRDICLSEERIAGYRNFANKIWNASRFSLMYLSEDDDVKGLQPSCFSDSLPDRWITTRLNQTISTVRTALNHYKFNEAANCLYQFIWHEFCDWYLEMIKPALSSKEQSPIKDVTRQTLLITLNNILRLLHPFMPFITEELWQKLPIEKQSIMVSSYPENNEKQIDTQAIAEMELVIDIATAIRNIRSENNISPSLKIPATLKVKDPKIIPSIKHTKNYIMNLARLDSLNFSSGKEKPIAVATQVIKGVEIQIPLKGIINLEEEIKRLDKELDKVAKSFKAVNKKLSNDDFLQKAPPEVIKKEEEKARELKEKQKKLGESLKKVEELIS